MSRAFPWLLALVALTAASFPFYRHFAVHPAARVIIGPGDWPQWRGPNRNDVSTETGLLKSWPAGGPKLLWTSRDVGLGYSAPAVVGDNVFTAGATGQREMLYCLDATSGRMRWSAVMGDVFVNDWGNGPRGTPSVDSDSVYMLSGRGDLVAVDLTNGAIRWHENLKNFSPKPPRWGYGESVLVDGDLVVCTPGASAGTIVAFQKRTGRFAWQSLEITDQAHFSSIMPLDVNGEHQLVQFTKEHVFAVAAKDGKLRWQADFPGRTIVSTPVVRSPYVYVSAGMGCGCLMVKVGPENKIETMYENKVMKNHQGGVILLGDYLYGHSDPIGWVCQEFLTGKQVWAERAALGKGPVTCADGMLYCVEEDTGQVVLVEASPSGWHEASRFKLQPQTTHRTSSGRIWTHPVVSHGRLYLRDQELQFCFDVAAK